jgi:hypothetical protein
MKMSENNSKFDGRPLSSIRGVGEVNLFERVVSSKDGPPKKIALSEQQIKLSVSSLLDNEYLIGLIKDYCAGLGEPASFSETDEVALRQKIFPLIDEEMRGVDPKYSIFSTGILELLFAEIEKGN